MNEQPSSTTPPPAQDPTQTNQSPAQPQVSQPSPAATHITGQPSIQSPEVAQKSRRLAYWLAIASIVVFAVQLFLGIYFAAAVLLSVWPLYIGLRLKAKSIIILSVIGGVANLGAYIVALLIG